MKLFIHIIEVMCIYSSKGHGENKINNFQQHIQCSLSETIYELLAECGGYRRDTKKMFLLWT